METENTQTAVEPIQLEQELPPNEQALLRSFLQIVKEKKSDELDAKKATENSLEQYKGMLLALVNLHGLEGMWLPSQDCSKLIRRG